ncbi:MAG: CotH kinase family protein [Bacteroides sp.]|nr:CotH kinase family protein [Bacteroides sp.]
MKFNTNNHRGSVTSHRKASVFSLLTFLLLLCAGCGDDEAVQPVPENTQPEGYKELIEAYQAGKVFASAQHTSGNCVLTFTDGYVLSIAEKAFKIADCTTSAPATVTTNGASWCVGGTQYSIKVDTSLTDEEALPVYAYFDSTTLYLYLSNKNVLRFWSVVLEEQYQSEAELARKQNIPVIRLTTEGPIVDKKNYVNGTITVQDPEKHYSEVTEFSSEMGIRGRGNSTWSWPKKPWKVKLSSKAEILGMPADKEWALLANYSDRTLMRNIVAMKLSEMCGFSWTPRIRSVHVYLNDEYQGVYTICEHKKVSASRVNIEVIDEADNTGEALTGGYYLEIESDQDADVCWWTSMAVPLMFGEPETPTNAQINYVKNLINDFETALCSETFADSETGYAAYIDLKSFIDFYIVQELTKNVDGNVRKSAFLTKERGKKLEMYHLWDFDLTMGNCGYFDSRVGNGPEGFWVKDYNSSSVYGDGWYWRLFQDPAFVAQVKQRWNELKPQFETIPTFIETQAQILDAAQKKNFEVWSIHESVDWVKFPSRGSYKAEVDYLKSFYTKRLDWLDKELSKL